MCAIKYKKSDKEFQIMQQFFSLMKKYGSVNSEDDIDAYKKEAADFVKDEEVLWDEYKQALVDAWEQKLRAELKQRLLVMNEYYKYMQQFAKVEKDEEWEKAIPAFNNFALQLNPNWEQFNRQISEAWLSKLEAEYRTQQTL